MGTGAGDRYSINLPVEKGSYEDAWFSLLEHIVIPAAEEFQPDLVLISAGYDAHRDDELGGCELEASSFAEMARHIRGPGERTGAPVGAVLEGSYALDALDASVRPRWRPSPAMSRRTPLRRTPSPLQHEASEAE